MKRGLAGILKGVAGMAFIVFLLAPVAGMGIVVCISALFVAVIAGAVGSNLNDDDEGSNSGYWPRDPRSPN
jgi:hypothetical protein